MKRLSRNLCLAILAISLSQVAHAQQTMSIEQQLRDQIQKLTAISNDPATPPDIRNINRGFVEQRRSQLRALLKEKLTALQKYQATVKGVLTAAENQVIAREILDTEQEIKGLESALPANPNFVRSTRPVELASLSGGSTLVPSPFRETDSPNRTTADTPAPQASPPATPAESSNFNNWLSNRIDERIKASSQAKIDQRSNVNQTEAPSVSDNSTSLVDQSSASDLIGVALNLAGLTKGTNNSDEKNSAAVTATAYSLYSALRGEEPLDPSFYNRHRNWRRLSFTLGFEKGQPNASGQNTQDTTIAGAKYLIVARRDASYHQRELGVVYENLKAAAVNFAQLTKEHKNFLLFADPTMRNKLRIADDVRFFIQSQIDSASTNSDDKKEYEALLKQPEEVWFDFAKEDEFANVRQDIKKMIDNKWLGKGFENLLKALGDDGLKQIDQFIDAKLEAFTNLNNASRRAIEKIRRAPQFSLSFQSKLSKQGPDEYMGEAIFDYGVHDRVNLTLNGGYVYKNSKIVGGDLRSARFAGQLQFQVTPEKSLVGRSPLYFYLASEGNWVSGTKSIFKLQGKVKIPIAEGIDLPLSLTYANRTELIKDKDVRGQFGFTIDTAKLFRAFLSKQ
jgi:hypothetical protein